MSFTPAMDVADVERGPYRATCQPVGFPPLCLVGESKTVHAYDATLRNGWTVQESWVEVVKSHSQGADYGGYFDGGPAPGSATLRASVVVWADAYSMVECRFHFWSRDRGGRASGRLLAAGGGAGGQTSRTRTADRRRPSRRGRSAWNVAALISPSSRTPGAGPTTPSEIRLPVRDTATVTWWRV